MLILYFFFKKIAKLTLLKGGGEEEGKGGKGRIARGGKTEGEKKGREAAHPTSKHFPGL